MKFKFLTLILCSFAYLSFASCPMLEKARSADDPAGQNHQEEKESYKNKRRLAPPPGLILDKNLINVLHYQANDNNNPNSKLKNYN